MNLLDMKISNIEFQYAGEAYIIIKAIRDAYAFAQREAQVQGDVPALDEYAMHRIKHFNHLLAEADHLVREEERIYADLDNQVAEWEARGTA